jgi:hypothetical protein
MEAPFMLAVTLASARWIIRAGMRARSENEVRHEEEDERRSLSLNPFLSVFPTFAKSVDPGGFFLLSGKKHLLKNDTSFHLVIFAIFHFWIHLIRSSDMQLYPCFFLPTN